MAESLTVQESPPLPRRRRGAQPGRGRGNGKGKGRAPKFTAWDVIQALRRGQNFSDIARARGVTTGDVTRTFHRATAAQLVALFEGLTTQADVAAALTRGPLAPVTLTTPVDVMQVMIGVLERAQGLERFLDRPPPGITLDPGYQIAQHLKLMDAKLQWAKDFVDTRLKMLSLVTLDTWLQELLAMRWTANSGVRWRRRASISASSPLGSRAPAPRTHPDEAPGPASLADHDRILRGRGRAVSLHI
jgi:hypothetical protein